jgi:hypothetical protein
MLTKKDLQTIDQLLQPIMSNLQAIKRGQAQTNRNLQVLLQDQTDLSKDIKTLATKSDIKASLDSLKDNIELYLSYTKIYIDKQKELEIRIDSFEEISNITNN